MSDAAILQSRLLHWRTSLVDIFMQIFRITMHDLWKEANGINFNGNAFDFARQKKKIHP